jgi:hypothetical protein
MLALHAENFRTKVKWDSAERGNLSRSYYQLNGI